MLFLLGVSSISTAQSFTIQNDASAGKIMFGNEKMKMTLDYRKKANVSSLAILGQEVMSG